MSTEATSNETSEQRGVRRLLQTVELLRRGTRDPEEAQVFLNEETRLTKRLTKLLRRMQSQPEKQAA